MTQEEKAKAYDDLLVKLQKAKVDNDVCDERYCCVIDSIVPELKESEDERIREKVITTIHLYYGEPLEDEAKEMIAWLEKQGEKGTNGNEREIPNSEQKPADKIEPKFHKGDWVVTNYGKVNQVVSVDKDGDGYTLDDGVYFSGSWCDMYHLWTIQDAKDGDVLATLNHVIIFKKLFENDGGISYCHYDFGAGNPQFVWFEDKNWYFGKGAIIHPATKEQHNLLFQKMHEAGYAWDAEKKELRKVKQTSTWSEEDERIYKSIAYSFAHNCPLTVQQQEFVKSLKNRVGCEANCTTTWKPSDEQMEVLNWCKPLWNEPKTKTVLESLIKDLKNLREE